MSENTLVYGQIREKLLSKIPELKDGLQETFGSDYDLRTEDPGGYPIFEDVVQPFLFALLASGGNQSLLKRLFDFFESMATSSDGRVTDLLRIAILETLVSRPNEYSIARQYLGKKTKEFADFEERL